MLFLIIFISVLKISWNRTVLPFKLFIGIVSVAMLTEDMLTTQAGVSLVAFFLSIFVLGNFRVETSSKTTNQIN
jgi:hypothetical protein